MSRNAREHGEGRGATWVRACVVLLCCLLAIVLSFVASWIVLPWALNNSRAVDYDPTLYPVDTALGAVLPAAGEGTDVMTGTVFVGDQHTAAMQSAGLFTIDQYVGAAGLSVTDLLTNPCVCFVNDGATYTIPQALAMMKPRRILLTLGSNNAGAGMAAEDLVLEYRQAVSALVSAYGYCDVIVNAVPPVTENSADAAARQTLIDQYNQALARMCEENGYKFLNSSEALKNASGFAEGAYFDSATGTLNAAGGTALLQYFRTHPQISEDRRPDTNDIPPRAAQPSGTAQATPSPTPLLHTVSYNVEEGRGTLRGTDADGNAQEGLTNLRLEVADRATVSVTAVAAEGWTFYKWSDGQTSETRTDVVTRDISVTAMFNDARVSITLDRGDTTVNVGDSVSINANLTLGGQPYGDPELIQWVINDDYVYENEAYGYSIENGSRLIFSPRQAGTYVVRAGAEINGGHATAELTVTVNAPQSLTISGPTDPVTVGSTITLTANVQNLSGNVTWGCDQVAVAQWSPAGTTVSFTPTAAGQHTIRASCDGVTAVFYLNVTGSADPAPPAEPQPGEVTTG